MRLGGLMNVVRLQRRTILKLTSDWSVVLALALALALI